MATPALTAALLTGFAATNVAGVVEWTRSDALRFHFPPELFAAARLMEGLDPEVGVRFYSDRWSAHIEAVRWRAPHVRTFDGSVKFGGDGTIHSAGPVTGRTLYILMPGYLHLLDRLRAEHPGGRHRVYVDRRGRTLFGVYYLDERLHAR